MKRALTIASAFIIAVLVTACGSKPAKQAAVDPNAPVYNTEKPTTYAEYKAWRKDNDPASEAYAEYKEWEINYRRWKQIQEQ